MKRFLLFILFPFVLFGQTQIGLDIDGEAAGDESGFSVSLSSDGTVVAIGAKGNGGNGPDSGHVRIYQNIGGVWTQIGSDIDGEAAGDESGFSVSLSSDGTVVAIGATGNDENGDDSGHVRVYENQSGTWSQIGNDIDGEAAGDESGFSVSLSSDGTIVAIGALFNGGNGSLSGHVRVYQNTGGVWTQIGSDIDGEVAVDFFGYSVSLSSDGTVVAIGAILNDGNGSNSGHVRVYKNQSGTWSQIGNDIDGEAADDSSGIVSLSSDGNIVAIGAWKNGGNGAASGHVRVYQNIGGVWTQIGQDINGEAAGDESGISVSLSSDGTVVAIGAIRNDGNGVDSGLVRVYKNQSGTWSQIGSDIYGESERDLSGFDVSLSSDGTVVAIGAIANSENNGVVNSGHVRVYDLSAVLSVQNNTFGAGFLVYPNPVNSVINIEIQEVTNGNWQLINPLGQIVKESNFEASELKIRVQDLNSGIYFLKITDSELNQSITKRIIVSD